MNDAVVYGPACDGIGAAAAEEVDLSPPPGRWDYCRYDGKRSVWRAERKGWYSSGHWGSWRLLGHTARLTRLDLCVDVLGSLPEFPGRHLPGPSREGEEYPRDSGWRRDESGTGISLYYEMTECQWCIYVLEDDAAPEHRPAQYIEDLAGYGARPSEVVRFEARLHGERAREAGRCEDAAAAWARVPLPPFMAVPAGAGRGDIVRPGQHPTVPPSTAEEMRRRLEKYVKDSGRRYARRCGMEPSEFAGFCAAILRKTASSLDGDALDRVWYNTRDATQEREEA